VPPDDLEAAVEALREELRAQRAERARAVERLRAGYEAAEDPDLARRRRRGKLTPKERKADARKREK
jgi:hypothetical protein